MTPIKQELEKQVDPFGEVIGLKGKIIQSFKTMSGNTFKEIVEKEWPKELHKRFEEEQDPFVLIINVDFKVFDPMEHPWSIIWFSNFWDKTDSIYRLFGSLAKKVRKNEDLFQYMRSVGRKDEYKKWAKYISLKTPEMFGVSIDVKAILEDLTGLDDGA